MPSEGRRKTKTWQFDCLPGLAAGNLESSEVIHEDLYATVQFLVAYCGAPAGGSRPLR